MLLLLALASSGFVLQTQSFALPALLRAWQVPVEDLAAVFALHLLGITLGAVVFGRLGDMAGRKHLLLCAAALQAVATLACIACSSPLQLAALRLLAGAGVGGIGANAVAMTVELAPRQGRTLWTTLVLGGVALGSSLPAVALQWHSVAADWQFLFMTGGLATLALLPALALSLPAAHAPAAAAYRGLAPGGGFRALLARSHRAPTLLLWAAYAGSMLAMHLITSWLPVLLESAGHAPARAATLTGWIHLAGVFAVLVSAPLFAISGMRWLALLLMIALSSTALLAALGLGTGALDLLVLAFGFGMVGSQSVLGTLAAHLYPEQCRATGVGAALAAGRLGSMLGPLAGGAIQAAGHPARGMFILPLCAISAALLAAWGLARILRGQHGPSAHAVSGGN